jgi:hypothetical protein
MAEEYYNHKILGLELGGYDLTNMLISLVINYTINNFVVGGTLFVSEAKNLFKDLIQKENMAGLNKLKLTTIFSGNNYEGDADIFYGEFFVTGMTNVTEKNGIKVYSISFVDELTLKNIHARIKNNIEGNTKAVFTEVLKLLDCTPNCSYFRVTPTLKYKFYANNMRPFDFLNSFLNYSTVDGEHIDTLFFRKYAGLVGPKDTGDLDGNIIQSLMQQRGRTTLDVYVSDWVTFGRGRFPHAYNLEYRLKLLETDEKSLRNKYELRRYEILDVFDTLYGQDAGHYGTSVHVYDFGTGRHTTTPITATYKDGGDVRALCTLTNNKAGAYVEPYEMYNESNKEKLPNERFVFCATGFTPLTQKDYHISPIGVPTPYGQAEPQPITSDETQFFKAKAFINIFPNLARSQTVGFHLNSCPNISIGDTINVTCKETVLKDSSQMSPWIDGSWVVISVEHILTVETATTKVICCRVAGKYQERTG